MSKYRWLVFVVLCFCLLECIHTKHGRFNSELGFMHCLCGTTMPYRMQRLKCMEQFVPSDNAYRMSHSVQYCGYFVNKTNFGQTVRQRIYIPNYNPWEPAPDLNTGIICGYTRIQPGNASPPNYWYVTSKGWIISKCILNMAKIDSVRADYMIKTCCY